MLNIVNFFTFQFAWITTVYFAAIGRPYVGVLITLIWIFCHLYAAGTHRLAELHLLLTAAVIGYLIDSMQVLSGSLSFPLQTQLGGPSPLWMVALWVNFAATLNYSMKWLHGHLFLAALLGAIAGSFAYYAGSRLGAIEIKGKPALIMIAIQWLIATPLLVWFAAAQPWVNRAPLTSGNSENK
ncbi:MAG: DUF2878 family protein [Gammaproteobacteria bacterium]|nr:DUF2878 family protein [Gammaproteobacteria bacterium]